MVKEVLLNNNPVYNAYSRFSKDKNRKLYGGKNGYNGNVTTYEIKKTASEVLKTMIIVNHINVTSVYLNPNETFSILQRQ